MGLASLDVQCFIVRDFRSAHPWNVLCIGRGALPERYYEFISIQLHMRREFVEAFFALDCPRRPMNHSLRLAMGSHNLKVSSFPRRSASCILNHAVLFPHNVVYSSTAALSNHFIRKILYH